MEEMKKEAMIDNSKLEEIMKKEITPESQREFLLLLKDSQLFMPVTFSENMFEGIENSKEGDIIEPKGQVGFDINFLKGNDGTRAVPLFTSSDVMESTGVKSSAVAIFMSDLAGMLKQTDKYSAIVVNPFTEFEISMPIEAFLGFCVKMSDEEKEFFEGLTEFLKIIKENSIELEENTTLFLRDDENFMIENAVDGIFRPELPFRVSGNPKYGEDLKYTNLLMMPKSKKIFPIGSDDELNVIIAPGTEFKHEDTLDGTTNLWMCGKQPFYDDE